MNEFWRRFQNLLHRREFERDLDEEMRFHLDMKARESDDYSARRQFGNVARLKETSREVWGWASLERLVQDLRYALRMMRRSPGFTSVAVLSLALGIGANTAIFGLINAVLLNTWPVKEPERMVAITPMRTAPANPYPTYQDISYPLYKDFRDRTHVFDGVIAASNTFFYRVALDKTGETLEANQIRGRFVSGNYFPVLGVDAVRGRAFTEDDDRVPSANPIAVVGYGFWEQQLGSDPEVLGRTIRLNGVAFTIIGVTPRGFYGDTVGTSVDIYVPITMQPNLSANVSWLNSRNTAWIQPLARLKTGVTLAQATAELTALYRQIVTDEAAGNPKARALRDYRLTDYRVVLEPSAQGVNELRARFSRPLAVIMAIAALVLLIACCNVANLLLARASARQKEIGVRLAMGSSRLRLIRQLLTESTLLAIFGGVLGLLLAVLGGRVLVALVSNPSNPLQVDLTPDVRVLGFTFAVSLLTGVIFGLVPALQATSTAIGPALKETSRGISDSRQRQGYGKAIVTAQVTLSLVLLAGAGLLVRTLQNLRAFDAGINRHNLLLLDVLPDAYAAGSFAGSDYRSLARQVDERLNSIPGIRSASLSTYPTFTGASSTTWASKPGQISETGEDRTVCRFAVSPHYFETMGMMLLTGRFLASEDTENSRSVVVINETAARFFFPGEDPIGKFLSFGRTFDKEHSAEIVGMVKDARYRSLREAFQRCVYMPQSQSRWPFFAIEVRTQGNPLALAGQVRQALKEVKSTLIVRSVRTFEEQIERTLTQERMFARLCTAFGLLALSLACIGLYGIMSYAVIRRTNEIGIRMALGARRSDVLWLVLREMLLVVSIGLLLGLPAALGATRLLESFLFGLRPDDPVTLAAASGMLLVVAGLAGYFPARRAARIDPMEALRYE